MKPCIPVTLILYENRDHTAAVELLAKMCSYFDFAEVRLLNWHRGYPQFLYVENYEAWKYVTASHSLTIHLDGYITNPELWDPSWLEYDYIGAPWPEDLNPVRVGNGGFCLKSRALMNRVAALPWVDVPGDLLVCNHYRQQLIQEGFKFAPVDVAARFSTEAVVPETVTPSFGFHQIK